MKIVLGLMGFMFAFFAVIELLNVVKSQRAKRWKYTIGKLSKWNIRSEEDSEDTRILIEEFKYTYEANGKEYESQNIGFGFPNGMSALYIEREFKRILEDSPKLHVYYNPTSPEISVLSVGFKMHHLVKILGYTLVILSLSVIYAQP